MTWILALVAVGVVMLLGNLARLGLLTRSLANDDDRAHHPSDPAPLSR